MAEVNPKVLYQVINSLRLELKGDISTAVATISASQGKLEQKFDSLEQGRLAAVEKDTNDLKVKQATASTKLAVIGFIAATITGAVVSTLISKLVS
jgi:hypothetical protein